MMKARTRSKLEFVATVSPLYLVEIWVRLTACMNLCK
jgi:hypothetical protein